MKSFSEECLEALSARVRKTPAGVKSLAHVRVIVPTVQSARRLKHALAARFGALVPPLVVTPLTARLDPSDPSLATRTDIIAAFGLARGRELADLRALLEPKALTFADVAAAIRDDLPEEAARWDELAALEPAYYAALEKRGKRDRIAALKDGVVVPREIEETLDWSMPSVSLSRDEAPVSRAQVFPCATPEDEANRVADYFAAVRATEALPALCVADPELFPEIESAFKARGLKIHNPAETRLTTSSLGRLVAQITALLATPDYGVFSAFIRGGDVRRWLKRELKIDEAALTQALVELDSRQSEYLPEKIDDIAPKTHGTLRAIFEFIKTRLRKDSLRTLLGSIFKDLTLDERAAGSREFAAAAEVVATLIDECGEDRALFELRLEEATYSLEPDVGEVILTDGWMELPFLDARELVIVGFREGCVPESTVGHPYLPDSLRRRLGLPDNAFKEARDRAILAEAVATRERQAVKIFFSSIDAKGDVVKPSRLLFETPDDEDLVQRVKTFYGLKVGTSEGSAPDLPEAWKLALPVPPAFRELTEISPTRVDGYLRCPFTFYLRDKKILGDKPLDDRAEELAAWEYGTLAHDALEAFGLSSIKDSTDVEAIRDFLAACVDEKLVARFGTAIPAIVAMQGESVKRRLSHFAKIQAARAAEGWVILTVERRFAIMYGHTRVHGKCDRIDYHPATGKWCVIDYKTWDSADRKEKAPSVQLALYCAMLDASNDPDLAEASRDRITSLYCILGKTADDVCFTGEKSGLDVPAAEELTRETIMKIEKGLFWPPAHTGEWRYDYENWLSPRPEDTVSSAWIADQQARLASYEESLKKD